MLPERGNKKAQQDSRALVYVFDRGILENNFVVFISNTYTFK